MDLSAYAALGGLERVAIILGALIIGYWGYRLYGRDRKPGLVFMGVACAVLIAALATGGSYLRNVGASYQLAGTGDDASAQPGSANRPASEAAAENRPEANLDGHREEAPAQLATEASTTPGSEPEGTSGAPSADSAAATAGDQTIAQTDDLRNAAAEPEQSAAEDVDAAATTGPDLASSEELGGRIVSVKSANVTLEWSRE